jgi:hypothetical protein
MRSFTSSNIFTPKTQVANRADTSLEVSAYFFHALKVLPNSNIIE